MTFLDSEPSDTGRTRIKLCGMTRERDIDYAVTLDTDAIGLIFYPPSPRNLSIEQATRLAARVPPSIAKVGLFVNASRERINEVLDAVPLDFLQLHGDESPEDCSGYRIPHIKAARMKPGLDLLEFSAAHHEALALLLDSHTAAYGGSGKVFDWSLVPPELIGTIKARAGARRVVLSGGLNAANVADAIARVRPYAVDALSGVESSKGIKDPIAMRDFVAAVRAADRITA
jgi:phosphoribosylanthranilate isomerase